MIKSQASIEPCVSEKSTDFDGGVSSQMGFSGVPSQFARPEASAYPSEPSEQTVNHPSPVSFHLLESLCLGPGEIWPGVMVTHRVAVSRHARAARAGASCQVWSETREHPFRYDGRSTLAMCDLRAGA